MKISNKEKAEELVRCSINRIAAGETITSLLVEAGMIKGFNLLGLITDEQYRIIANYICDKIAESEE